MPDRAADPDRIDSMQRETLGGSSVGASARGGKGGSRGGSGDGGGSDGGGGGSAGYGGIVHKNYAAASVGRFEQMSRDRAHSDELIRDNRADSKVSDAGDADRSRFGRVPQTSPRQPLVKFLRPPSGPVGGGTELSFHGKFRSGTAILSHAIVTSKTMTS